MEISQANWRSGDVIAFGSGKTNWRWGFKVHNVSQILHARQQLEKIMNQTVIVKVCCGSNGEEAMHEERVE